MFYVMSNLLKKIILTNENIGHRRKKEKKGKK
jgi:hypothetical protein